MALRPEYSLVHSEFNDFLFALVGQEKSGMQLTVLSALGASRCVNEASGICGGLGGSIESEGLCLVQFGEAGG